MNNVHDLGAVMMLFPLAQAIDAGVLDLDTQIETPPSIVVGRFRINDFLDNEPSTSAGDIFKRSSHVGMASISKMVGSENQRPFLHSLGFFEPTALDAQNPTDLLATAPAQWGEVEGVTVAYGYGLTSSPLQLAAAYSSILNGGTLVMPTFLPDSDLGPQVVSATTSAKMRGLLRDIVEGGVGTPARVADLEVGGKTGSADLRLPSGAYSEAVVINTFAAVFPVEEPEFVLVTMLEGATAVVHGQDKNTASWTVVPLSGEILTALGQMVVAR